MEEIKLPILPANLIWKHYHKFDFFPNLIENTPILASPLPNETKLLKMRMYGKTIFIGECNICNKRFVYQN